MRRLLILPVLAVVVGLLCSAQLSSPGAASIRQRPARFSRQIAALPTRQEAGKLHPALAAGASTGAALGSGDLIWYGGQVEEHPRVFLIFWGFAWNNGSGGLTRDATLVTTFFSEVSNTPFQNMLTQYGDRDANPSSSLTVGGIWLDSMNPPVNSQTCGGPTIDDSSAQNEIAQAIKANSWPSDVNSTYLLYTPLGYFVNQGGGPAFCSEQQFCAYHGMSYTAQAPYAVIPFPTGQAGARERPTGARGAAPGAVQRSGPEAGGGSTAGCMVPNSPNNNLAGDSLVNLSSVEQANVATDPHLDAYFDASGFEIGDKCAWNFAAGQMTLDNGDAFELQTEYSNQDHDCISSATHLHSPRQGPGSITHFSAAAPTQTLTFSESGWLLLAWLGSRQKAGRYRA
jgi:hypothetical protein